MTRPRTGWQYGRRASEVGLIELVDYLNTPNLNEIGQEMVEAARTNFEESLSKLAVLALTEPKWQKRVAFPLGMSEEGDLFYGASPERG